jgi:hypothetical protein
MFCAWNGATEMPRPRNHAQIAVVIQLLPAFEDVPPTKSVLALAMTLVLCLVGYHARENRLPAFPVTSRSEALTPASCSSLRPNSHNRSESRFT